MGLSVIQLMTPGLPRRTADHKARLGACGTLPRGVPTSAPQKPV